MPRIRSIKPESFSSEILCQVPIPARWTFAGLWTYCDDKGRGKAEPRLIKAALYPLDDDITTEIVERHLDALVRVGVLCRYEVDGRRLLHVVNFREHQHPSKPQSSKFPECPRVVDGGPPEGSHTPPEPFPERSGSGQGAVPVGVVVVSGREEEVEEDTPLALALRDEPAALTPHAETLGQHGNRLAKAYTDRVKLSNFPAIAGIARKAIQAGKTDAEITDAFIRLAEEGRPVTADTLRIEIEGLRVRGTAANAQAETEAMFDRAAQRAASREVAQEIA